MASLIVGGDRVMAYFRPTRKGLQRASQCRKVGGFTLIELLVVMVIIATLLSVVAPRYFRASDDAREAALKANLASMRDAIDHFHGDRGLYPETLSELVDRRYLRSIPTDPLTGSAETWKLLPPPEPPPEKSVLASDFQKSHAPEKTLPVADNKGIYDVHSGAVGETKDGVPFEDL